jgi:hypothetical protein
VPGQIKNVYSKKDYILLLYSCSEGDFAIGRNSVFTKMISGRNFSNDQGGEPDIAEGDAFALKNYDL